MEGDKGREVTGPGGVRSSPLGSRKSEYRPWNSVA